FATGDPFTTANANGQYTFNGLGTGNWIVRVIPSANWAQSTPTNNYGQHIALTNGGTVSNVNFGFYPTVNGTISGTVFNDANKSRAIDTGESGVGNWSVYIDLGNTSKYAVGDPLTSTNSSGQYKLNGL